jgi:hypothetical protein
MSRLSLISAVALFVAGCAGSPETKASVAGASGSALGSVPSEGLPPQSLAAGECGLFLWGMSAPRKFVFFANGTTSNALILLNDQPQRMSMLTAGGDVFGQFLTEMRFQSAPEGGTVSVSIKPGDVLDGGQRVDSGNILFRDAQGWETVLPVTGVRACIPG